MIEYITSLFPENRAPRTSTKRTALQRVHRFVPPGSQMRLREAGQEFGQWRREKDGVPRLIQRLEHLEVGPKIIVQRESDMEQLSIRTVESLFIPDLGANPTLELLSAELVDAFGMDTLRDGGLYVCRYIDGTHSVSRHGYVKKSLPAWKGSARDWFVRSGGMTTLWQVARFQVSRIQHHNVTNAHVIVDSSIYTHPGGWTGYRGAKHLHTHIDTPGGEPCL
jgi:hypothetical protein